ncbi:MAG: radical SAM protein [Phycisphaerae bacterium]|nr:radical SAM protein [Phycisphaerae bacterium]
MIERVAEVQEAVGSSASANRNPWGPLREKRREMRRFADRWAQLPVETRATCPRCGEVRPARFERRGEQVVLTIDCPACDVPPIVHHDAIWTPLAPDWPGSAAETFHGSRIHPVIRRLPCTVETLCPECGAIVVGRYFVRDGAVFMEKTCPEHGYARDRISPSVALFTKAAWWNFEEHPGQKYPQVKGAKHCPSDCGLCNQHLSAPVLAQIDLTNRCNMRCPICFANANASGYVYEPDYDEIVREMRVLRDMRPTVTTAIQFTGGEPTIHPDFLKIVAKAKEMGFSHIQIATNGIRMADPEFARQAAQAGLHTLYLQFDGVGDDAYQATRNYPGIWEKKLAALESCRANDMKVCLVPTIVRGVNDEQIPKIFQFAIDNIDVVSGISWQPVSFSGRINWEEREKKRFTLGDLALALGKIEGLDAMRDMYPIGLTVPISNLLEAMTGDPKIRASAHPICAFGTYILVSPEGKPYPFPKVVNVEGMFWEMNRHAERIRKKGKVTLLDKLRLFRMFKKVWKKDGAPPDLSVRKFIRSIMGMVDKKVGRGRAGQKTYRSLLCAGMHFQDRYNFDVERVKRCVILYSTPAGVFPFCTHNCGPEYRYLSQAGFVRELKDEEYAPTIPQEAKS